MKFSNFTVFCHDYILKFSACYITFLIIAVGLALPVRADDAEQRQKDIEAKLADLLVGSPLERAVKLDAAMKSDDPLLRSYALEQALQDEDNRVREIALMALIKSQKSLLLQVQITQEDLEKLSKTSGIFISNCFGAVVSTEIKLKDIDEKTGHIIASLGYGSGYTGSVDRAGLTILYCEAPPYGTSKFVFRGSSSGYLIGTLNYGPTSFPAKIAAIIYLTNVPPKCRLAAYKESSHEPHRPDFLRRK